MSRCRWYTRSQLISFFLRLRPPPISTLFPYTTLFRSLNLRRCRLWLRTPDGTRYTSVTSPGDEAELVTEVRSEEHTSELQSLTNLVCRLLREKKEARRSIVSVVTNFLPHCTHVSPLRS